MFDKDKFKTSLSETDIKKILDYYNSDYFEGNNGELVAQTCCHNHSDGSHKLYYYPENHTFHCYTGCGSFDVYDLIEKASSKRGKKLNFSESIKEIGRILGKQINFSKSPIGFNKVIKTIDDWDWLNKVVKKEQNIPKLKKYDKKVLNPFIKAYPSEWYKEGISVPTMRKYNIMFYQEMFQTVIPHYDENGEIIGIRSRNWKKDLVKRAKYIPTYVGDTGYNHPLGYALYGLYQNKENIKRRKKAMIVEGEKSCLFSDTLYGDNNFVVAICGSSMSKYQADLLLELGIEEVIIALDKEYFITESDGFEEYMNKVKKIGRLFAPYINTYHITDTRGYLNFKESPLDVSKEVLENIMEHDRHVLTLKELESRG